MLSCFVQYLTRAICRPILFQKISSKRSAINDELTTLFVLLKLIAKGVSDVLCKAGNVYICCSVSKLFKDFPSCPSTTGPHPTGPHSYHRHYWQSVEQLQIIISYWMSRAQFVFYNSIPVRDSRFCHIQLAAWAWCWANSLPVSSHIFPCHGPKALVLMHRSTTCSRV